MKWKLTQLRRTLQVTCGVEYREYYYNIINYINNMTVHLTFDLFNIKYHKFVLSYKTFV